MRFEVGPNSGGASNSYARIRDVLLLSSGSDAAHHSRSHYRPMERRSVSE